MRNRSHLLTRSFWRKRSAPFVTRFLIRPSIDLRGLPLVAVTGTSGKTSVTLLVERILRDAGYRTGCACTEGVIVKGRWIRRGDESGSKGLWRASRTFGLDALVAETARGGILRNGLGFSRCDVSVVTNVDEDHMGLRGITSVEQMAEVKSILPRSTRERGTTVLNLDQPLVRDMAAQSLAHAVYFSMEEPPAAVEDCFYLEGTTIFRKRGAAREPQLAVADIFLTYGGAVTFQIANAMAAMAVVEALQAKLPVPRASLARSLAEFGRRPEDMPLRLQLFRYEGLDVLLSATKNPSNYELEVPLIRRIVRAHGYRRVICVVTEVGNRQEKCYRAASRAVSSLGDAVACIPPGPKYFRGRSASEIVRLLEIEVPAEKLVRPPTGSLRGVFEHFRSGDLERTLFVAFASVFYGDTARDIVAQGQSLPIRFDALTRREAPR